MDAITVLLVLVLLVCAMWYLLSGNSEKKRVAELVNKIPGPPTYPIIGTILSDLFTSKKDRLDVTMYRLNKYKPIVRVWIGPLPAVVLTLPEHVEIVLGSTKFLDKASGYKFLHPWLGTGLLTASGEKWHTHRKMITPSFHFKILENFIDIFSEKSKILVRKLENELGNQSFNVCPYITRCALDIICETAMGISVHAQDEEESTYVKAVSQMTEQVVDRLMKPWLYPDFIYQLTPSGRKNAQCLKILHDFTRRVIQDRKEQRVKRKICPEKEEDEAILGKKKRVAFLDMLLEASEDGVTLTDEEIREEVDTFMFGGHDTTSTAMCWTLFLLALHQDIQAEAYDELQTIFQGSDRAPTMKDLNEMKYLERVIKESLRLYPSVPAIARQLEEDIQIGEYLVPAGCTLNFLIYYMHRNPDVFPNPEKFNPDNFLPDVVAKRHPYAYIPFSAGPRNCVGQKFAVMEEKIVLSYILRKYEIRFLGNPKEVTAIPELVLRPENGIHLSIHRRH